jgi:hypothetical protein
MPVILAENIEGGLLMFMLTLVLIGFSGLALVAFRPAIRGDVTTTCLMAVPAIAVGILLGLTSHFYMIWAPDDPMLRDWLIFCAVPICLGLFALVIAGVASFQGRGDADSSDDDFKR